MPVHPPPHRHFRPRAMSVAVTVLPSLTPYHVLPFHSSSHRRLRRPSPSHRRNSVDHSYTHPHHTHIYQHRHHHLHHWRVAFSTVVTHSHHRSRRVDFSTNVASVRSDSMHSIPMRMCCEVKSRWVHHRPQLTIHTHTPSSHLSLIHAIRLPSNSLIHTISNLLPMTHSVA